MERKVKVGDKVKIVKVHPLSVDKYKIGDVFVVKTIRDEDEGVYVDGGKGKNYYLQEKEYEVLNPTLKDKIKPFTIAKLSDGTVGIFLPEDKEKLVLYSNEYTYITSLDSFDDNLKGIYPIGRNVIAIKNVTFPINALYSIYRSNGEMRWDWERKQERTEEEKKILETALQLGLKYVTRDADGQLVFWEEEPIVLEHYDIWCTDKCIEGTFLSMRRGDIFKEVTFDAGVVSLEDIAD